MMQSHRKWYKRTLALLLAVAMLATPTAAFAQTEPAAEEPAASVVYAPEDLAAFSEALDSAGYDLPDNTAALAALSEEQPDLRTQNIQMEVSPAAPASVLRTAQNAAPQAETFLQRPRESPALCARCEFRCFCGGFCKRMQREVCCTGDGDLCGYREFLMQNLPALQQLAQLERRYQRK